MAQPERKPTMTLNLSEREMAVVDQIAADHDISKTQVMRQALRLYQLVEARLKGGETMSFSGDDGRAALFVGIGFSESFD